MSENGKACASSTCLSEVFGADSTLADTLRRIASWAAEAIESTAFACITLTFDGDAPGVVSTDAQALEIERSQFESHEGPSIDAFRTARICRVPSTAAKGEWPAFREACHARGILSAAAFPLTSEGVTLGAMTLYSTDYHAFGTHETRIARSFADQAVTAILDARADELVRHPSDDPSSRGTRDIDRAQQVIMASTGVTADAALAVLLTQALDQDRTLEDVATDLINSKIVPLSVSDTG
jgi:GAF domain-containing protein